MCLERESVFWEQCVSSGHPLSILDNNSELLDSHYLSARLALWHSAKRTTMASGWIELYESREWNNMLRALVCSLSAAVLSVLDLLGFRFGVLTARWAWRAHRLILQLFKYSASHPDTRRHSRASLLVSKSTDAWVLNTCSLETEKSSLLAFNYRANNLHKPIRQITRGLVINNKFNDGRNLNKYIHAIREKNCNVIIRF